MANRPALPPYLEPKTDMTTADLGPCYRLRARKPWPGPKPPLVPSVPPLKLLVMLSPKDFHLGFKDKGGCFVQPICLADGRVLQLVVDPPARPGFDMVQFAGRLAVLGELRLPVILHDITADTLLVRLPDDLDLSRATDLGVSVARKSFASYQRTLGGWS